MSISIHDRVQIIKGESELETAGGGDELLPAHGATHVKLGSDPVPPEIDGIEADMDGIADGESPTYDQALGKFVPGNGPGSVPTHASTHTKGAADALAQEIDGIPVEVEGTITNGQVPTYNSTLGKFVPGPGGGSAPAAHAASHKKGGTDELAQEIDGIPVEVQGTINDGELVGYDALNNKFVPVESVQSGVSYLDFKTGLADPLEETGRVFWDDTADCLAFYNSKTGVKMNIGRETWVEACNNTGETILNGQVVYVSGATSGCPEIALATADNYSKDSVLAVATMDIPDGTYGEVTRVGVVNDIDTSAFAEGDVLYLAATERLDLPTSLTINGKTVEAAFVYEGNNFDPVTGDWIATVGENLTLTSTGSEPLGVGISPNRGKVGYRGGQYHQAATTGYADPGTDDIVMVLVEKPSSTTSFDISKGSTTPSLLAISNIAGTNSNVRVNGLARAVPNTLGDVSVLVVFIDRSGSMTAYRDNVNPGSTNVSSEAGVSLGTASKWTIGALSNGGSKSKSSILYFGMWHSPNWLDTHLQPELATQLYEIARRRYFPVDQNRGVINDGDMEVAGVTNWTAVNSATLTKEVTDPAEGLQVLKVAYNGVSTPRAQQAILEVGKKYFVATFARSGGTVTPKVYDGTTAIQTGTTSTDWQPLSFIFTATSTNFGIGFDAGSAGNYVEFDDVYVLEVNYQNGALTNTRPQFPAKPVIVGYCTKSHATEGQILTVIENDQFSYQFDGTCIERQDTAVVVDTGVVYLETELLGGGDLPVQLEGDVHLLNCTSGAGTNGRARVALTAGTDSVPQINFVYVALDGGAPVLKSSVTAPTGAFAFIAYISLWSATKTASYGPALHQRSTDAKEHDGRGRIAHISDKIRQFGSSWEAGVTPTATITTQAATLDDLKITVTGGSVRQMHPQAFPALDSSVDGIFVANASGSGTLTAYQRITNLNQCREYSDGTTIPNGERYNLVVWGAVNKNTSECKLFVNLPSKGYTSDDSAYYDVEGTSVTTVDRALFSVAFLIARIPVRYTTVGNGTLAFINPAGLDEIVSLLGLSLGASASGGTGGGGGASALNQLTDVEVTTPADGDVLEYNSVTGLWENVEGVNAVKFFGTDIEEFATVRDKLGPQLMLDADCEAAGTTAWTASGSATLTKTGAILPPGGGNQALKIAYNSVTSPQAYQDVAVSGKKYLLYFWAAGDGTNNGTFGNGVTSLGSIDTAATMKPYMVEFTATATKVFFEAADAAGAYITIDNVFLFEVREDQPVTGEMYRAEYLQNLLTYSEHFAAATSDWSSVSTTVNTDSGLLSPIFDRETGRRVEFEALQATAVSGFHYIYNAASGISVGDKFVVSGCFRKGTCSAVAVFISQTPQTQIYLNLIDGSISAALGKYEDSIVIRNIDGSYTFYAQFEASTANPFTRLYLGQNETTFSFTGDGSDCFYVTRVQVYKGTLADNLPYIKTTTAAETGRHEFRLAERTSTEERVKAGLLERVVNDKPSGIFETPKNNVLYVAPDYMQHKGQGNLVYAQAVYGDGVTGDISVSVASDKYPERLCEVTGGCLDYNNEWYAMGSYVSSTFFARALLNKNGILEIYRGSSMNASSDQFNVMFYFTLQENPDQE